jgi:hypothetical protein
VAQGVEGEVVSRRRTTLVAEPARAPVSESRHVWVDKNLAALGFFTPSSQRIKREKSKTVRFSQLIDGERVDVSATIVPSALYGLPVTADQDKYLALQEIVRAQRQAGTHVSNPVSFSSTALLRALGLCDSGRNHLDVSEWLDLMASTTIISEGAVYLAGSRHWARDRFRVFDRAVSRGQSLDDGSIAERHHVWLSDWQLQNINSRHLLPINFDVYQRLRTHIARALVLHLQIWLYASHRAQVFEKRYADICQLLGLRVYDHRSKIIEKLGPALEELAANRYVSGWQITRTADEQAFKLVLKHGALFTGTPSAAVTSVCGPSTTGQDESTSSARPTPEQRSRPEPPRHDVDEALVSELTNRGVTARRARQLLASVLPTQDVVRQLEWGDFVLLRAAPGTFWNPAGFYVALLRDNLEPPAHFLSAHQRAQREDARQALVEDRRRSARLSDAYSRYRDEQAAIHLAAMGASERDDALAAKVHELRSRFTSLCWNPEHLRSVAQASLRSELADALPLLDFRTFVEQMAGVEDLGQECSEETRCTVSAG